MLDAAVDSAGLRPLLDAVFSVDPLRLYKPRREVYAMAAEGLSAAPEDIVFVSSNRWDVMGAAAFGFKTVWVNRANVPDEYPDTAPAEVVTGLAALHSV
jgi:2-haloacid dehalogenase